MERIIRSFYSNPHPVQQRLVGQMLVGQEVYRQHSLQHREKPIMLDSHINAPAAPAITTARRLTRTSSFLDNANYYVIHMVNIYITDRLVHTHKVLKTVRY